MSTKSFDFIIIGAGLSGLHLAHSFLNDPFFKDFSIAIIDKSSKSKNDKTYCFWEKGKGNWDSILTKSWTSALVYGTSKKINVPLLPYTYKMVKSLDFYNFVLSEIEASNTIQFFKDDVQYVNEDNIVTVTCNTNSFQAKHVFDSRVTEDFEKDKTATTLLQHFKGCTISTKKPTFNPEVLTMMDYRLTYKNTTSFMYVLPITPTKALIEYTFFSPSLVEDHIYDSHLKTYISNTLSITDYAIIESEKGVIPMTDYKFKKHHTDAITKIGTAGGWVKGSSGYSFKMSEKKSKRIIENIKTGSHPTNGLYNNKFELFDVIFLKVLKDDNSYGPKLFQDFYSKNEMAIALKFLDEETSFNEDLKIVWSLRSFKFVKAFFKTLFRFR